MARRCDLVSKGAMSGNNVSHAVNRTRRRFLPNLQNFTLESEALKTRLRLRICTSTLRHIDYKGGLDSFLLSTPNRRLTLQAIKLKKRLLEHAS